MEEILEKLRVSAKKEKHSVAIRQARESLSRLRKLYEEHVTEHRVAWNRSHCDYYKSQSVFPPNVTAYNAHVLRTSAYKAGDVDLLRAPVVKVSKKNKRKKASLPPQTGAKKRAKVAVTVKKEMVKLEPVEKAPSEIQEIAIPAAVPKSFMSFGGKK